MRVGALLAALVCVLVVVFQEEQYQGDALSLPALPLRTSGRFVVDAKGNRVKFAGVNWYGFDSPDFVAGGLNFNTLENIVKLIVDNGFTAIRIPWALELYEKNPVVDKAKLAANPDLFGLRGLEILDKVVETLNRYGVLIMLDNHISDADWCCNTQDDNGLWFNQRYPAEKWLEYWKGMVTRYLGIPAVVAVDLRNELRANCVLYPGECVYPNWGGSNHTLDWAATAEAAGNTLLSINSNLLIVVEGLSYATDLTEVRNRPIKLKLPNRLVYQAHHYQWDHPFTNCYAFQKDYLNPSWGFIVQDNIAPLFLGEFGTCYTSKECVTSNAPWLHCITWYLWRYDIDWFYWAIDGTESSGTSRQWGAPETFGLLNTTWNGLSWPWFMHKLQALQHART